MKPSIKWGLMVGVAGAALNVCVSTLFGICGPVLAMLAGGVAGFFAGQAAGLADKGTAAREGAIAGGVAGGVVFFGQLLGGIGALILLQSSGASPLFGEIPTSAAPLTSQLTFYAAGLGTGVCFGLIGFTLSALAGAGIGYLAGPSAAPAAPASLPSA